MFVKLGAAQDLKKLQETNKETNKEVNKKAIKSSKVRSDKGPVKVKLLGKSESQAMPKAFAFSSS